MIPDLHVSLALVNVFVCTTAVGSDILLSAIKNEKLLRM